MLSKQPINMKTNTGSKKILFKRNIPDFRQGYNDLDHIANIFGFAHLAKRYHIMYNLNNKDAFLAHTNNRMIKFKRTPDRLYSYKTSKTYIRSIASSKGMDPPMITGVSYLVSTVSKNQNQYTTQQFDDVKKLITSWDALQ